MSDSDFTYKKCTVCKEIKHLDLFSRRIKSKDGKNYCCKKCQSDSAKRWHIANRDVSCKRMKEYKEKNKEYFSKLYKEWVSKNRDKVNSYVKKWDSNNPAKRAAHQAKRRSNTKKASPPWVDLKKIELLYQEAEKMRNQGKNVNVDHIIPLQSKKVCGLHVHWNLRIIDAIENKKKSNKLPNPDDFLAFIYKS